MKIFGLLGHIKTGGKKIFPESTVNHSPKEAQEIYRCISGELYTDGGIYSPEYNKNGELTKALFLLDCYDENQKRFYMSLCRRLSGSGISDEKFSEILSRGHYYGYVSEYYGKPDFSVMRDISPENFPHFLAVAIKSKNGYCRQEALRYAGEYPLLLSHITAAFGDRVEQVRCEAARAFDTAMENMPAAQRQNGPAAFEALLAARLALEKVQRGGHYDSGSARAAEEKLNGCISRGLDRDMARRCKSVYALRRMGGSLCYEQQAKAYVLLIKQGIISPEKAWDIICYDKYCRPAVSCAASAYLSLPEDMMERLADFPYSTAARNAVTKLFEKRGAWQGSEKYLMSRFAPVRETSVYYWRKKYGQETSEPGDKTDLYEYYKARLPDKAAVWGIGYCASQENREETAELLTGLINSDNTKAARAALFSLAGLYSKRECPEDIRELLYKSISDPRGRVSKAALDMFRRKGIIMDSKVIYNDITAALERGGDNATLTAKRLTMALTGQPVSLSGKFPWILRLCGSSCEDVRQTALRWITERLYNGRIFSGIGTRQRQEILAAAEEVFSCENASLLPEGLEEFIKFSLTGRVDHSGCDVKGLIYSRGNI